MSATVYMSEKQMSRFSKSRAHATDSAGDYLNDLRKRKVSRPTGSRPFPGARQSLRQTSAEERASRKPTKRPSLHTRASSLFKRLELKHTDATVGVDELASDVTAIQSRTLSREEEEQILHNAAMQQANELIEQHRLEDAGQVGSTSVQRSAEPVREQPTFDGYPTTFNEQQALPAAEPPLASSAVRKRNSYAKLAGLWHPSGLSHRSRSSGQRRVSSGKFKGTFPNPEDKIFEDPPESSEPLLEGKIQPEQTLDRPAFPVPPTPSQVGAAATESARPPSHVRRNPFARAQLHRDARATVSRQEPQRPIDSNLTSPGTDGNDNSTIPPQNDPPSAQAEGRNDIRYKNGLEIRSEELRAATSFNLKNRSPRLPRPTAVTNNIKAPIVSFKPDWTPPMAKSSAVSQGHGPDGSQGFTVSEPFVHTEPESPTAKGSPNVAGPRAATGLVPTICVGDDATLAEKIIPEPHSNAQVGIMPIPHICVSGPINADATGDSGRATAREFDSKDRDNAHRKRAASAVTKPAAWSVDVAGNNVALCSQCALPISGKIVTAAGRRFHPDCFTCFTCNEKLECVAFYPEPYVHRAARLERIEQRIQGEPVDPSCDPEADGDDGLRFFCHLDFHERFSPRCKSCKTPIEGEVVVACGAEWHVGHFFCAECGDVGHLICRANEQPFSAQTPFVERDGYAWCVGCHTKRYSTKCRRCRRPVTETVVKALDAEWHVECFVCTVSRRCLSFLANLQICDATFDDGRYFLHGGGLLPVCSDCEQTRLKS